MSHSKSVGNKGESLLLGAELCASCAAAGDCCCRTDTASAHLSFPLSIAEWKKIVPYSYLASDDAASPDIEGDKNLSKPVCASVPLLPPLTDGIEPPFLSGDTVAASEKNMPDFLEAMRALFPGEGRKLKELFPQEGRHLRLRLREDGACIFLGADGCRLPRVVRPWYCRLFPAWLVNGKITFFMSESCHMSRRIKTVEQGVSLLDMPEAEIYSLYSELRADWGLPLPRTKPQ